MKPLHRTVVQVVVAALMIAALILVTAPPRGRSVVLLPAPTAAPITVHMDGAVRSPGLYDLPPSSRLSAAIQAAGGLTDAADASAINLAAQLNDGDKWNIPAVGNVAGVNTQLLPESSRSLAVIEEATTVNLNTALAVELETLPGIGPVLAQQIVDYREEHGPFQAIEDLQDVPGIGPAKFESMKDRVTVD